MYQSLAHLYDNPVRTQFSENVLAVVHQITKRHEIATPGAVLDLAAGTGVLSTGLAQSGWKVTAVDISPAMLEIARCRAEKAQVEVRCELGDIRDYTAREAMTATLCFGDVVNHLLTECDVRALLRTAFESLMSGGLFIFDINTLETFRSALWNTNQTHVDDSGARLTVDANFDDTTAVATLDHRLDYPAHDNRPARSEAVQEHYYSVQALKTWAVSTGFEWLSSEPFNPVDLSTHFPEVETFKWLCVARRPPLN